MERRWPNLEGTLRNGSLALAARAWFSAFLIFIIGLLVIAAGASSTIPYAARESHASVGCVAAPSKVGALPMLHTRWHAARSALRLPPHWRSQFDWSTVSACLAYGESVPLSAASPSRDLSDRPLSTSTTVVLTGTRADAGNLIAADATTLAGEDGLAQAAADFIVHPNGNVIAVPEGAAGPFPTINLRGIRFEGGAGGHGLDDSAWGLRIMDPTADYPGGYYSYYNDLNQTIDPYSGQTLSPSNPGWHRGW